MLGTTFHKQMFGARFVHACVQHTELYGISLISPRRAVPPDLAPPHMAAHRYTTISLSTLNIVLKLSQLQIGYEKRGIFYILIWSFRVCLVSGAFDARRKILLEQLTDFGSVLCVQHLLIHCGRSTR